MIAYSPFGSPDLPWGEKLPHILTDPVLKRIAEKHERSTANVALRWLLQRGLATIPKVCAQCDRGYQISQRFVQMHFDK